MTDSTQKLSADSLPDVSRAISTISELERDAVEATAKDGFTAQIVSRHCTDQMSTGDRATLRRLCLGTIFRQISLQVQRCAAAGVAISGYEDETAWIESRLELLPKPDSDGEGQP